MVTSTLQVFSIDAGVDASGKPVELNTEVIGGLITCVDLTALTYGISVQGIHFMLFSESPVMFLVV